MDLQKVKDVLSIVLKIFGLLFIVLTGVWVVAKFLLPKDNVLWKTIQVWVSNPNSVEDSADADKVESAVKSILGR
jgi:hypothetical protein